MVAGLEKDLAPNSYWNGGLVVRHVHCHLKVHKLLTQIPRACSVIIKLRRPLLASLLPMGSEIYMGCSLGLQLWISFEFGLFGIYAKKIRGDRSFCIRIGAAKILVELR